MIISGHSPIAIGELPRTARQGEQLVTGTGVEDAKRLGSGAGAFTLDPDYPVVRVVRDLDLLAVANVHRRSVNKG